MGKYPFMWSPFGVSLNPRDFSRRKDIMTCTYKCEEHREFTIERSIKDEPLNKCPKCGKSVTQVYNTNGYIAKCSGFYGKSSK